MAWIPLAAAAVSALASKSGSGGTTTENREPWAPAQPYMLDNLKTGADLQRFYQQNPFNPQQIQNYSNLFSDINNFRNNTMPGLLDFANRGMNSSYQRQTGGAPGSGGGYGGPVRPGGLLQANRPGPFSMPQQLNGPVGSPTGLLDLNGAQNPYVGGKVAQTTPPTADALSGLTPEELAELRRLLAKQKDANDQRGGAGDGASSAGGMGGGPSGDGVGSGAGSSGGASGGTSGGDGGAR